MAEKFLNTRIALRIDTFENWSKTEVAEQGANLVLKANGQWARSSMYSFANAGISSLLSGWY